MLNEDCVDICENLGWKVSETEDGYVELEQVSPAGEDFTFLVETDNFIQDVKSYAQDFDADEHAEFWVPIRGEKGVPDTIRALIDDADAIKEMLQDLAVNLGVWERLEEKNKESVRWMLGEGLSTKDNLLDGITFEELINTIQCNCRKITKDEILKQALAILEMRANDMRELLEINIENIAKEVKARRNG